MNLNHLRMILHFTSSSRRSGKSRKKAKEARKGKRHLDKDVLKIQEYIDSRNAEGVKEEFLRFFNDFLFEENVLFSIHQNTQIVEYRVLRKVQEIMLLLSDVVEKSKFGDDGQLKKISFDMSHLHNVFRDIVISAHHQTSTGQRQKKGIVNVKDVHLSTEEWVFRMMILHSRAFRKDVRKETHNEDDLVHDIHRLKHLLEAAQSSGAVDGLAHSDKHRLQKLLSNIIKELDKEPKILHRLFEDAEHLDREISILSNNLHKMEEQELARLHELMSKGFPKNYVMLIDGQRQKVDREVHDHVVQTYQQAVKIEHTAKKGF